MATGDGASVGDLLHKGQSRLYGGVAMGSAGRAASITAVSAEASAQGAATVTYYSPQSRVGFLLQTHLPSLARGLADAVGAALPRAYPVAFGKALLDPEGGLSGQQGPAFARGLMSLKTSHGGGGCTRRWGACRSLTAP